MSLRTPFFRERRREGEEEEEDEERRVEGTRLRGGGGGGGGRRALGEIGLTRRLGDGCRILRGGLGLLEECKWERSSLLILPGDR